MVGTWWPPAHRRRANQFATTIRNCRRTVGLSGQQQLCTLSFNNRQPMPIENTSSGWESIATEFARVRSDTGSNVALQWATRWRQAQLSWISVVDRGFR